MGLRRQRCVGGDRDASEETEMRRRRQRCVEETKMRLKKWEGGILSGDVAVYRFAYALILTGFSVLFPVHILCFSGFGCVVPRREMVWREVVGRGSLAWHGSFISSVLVDIS